MKSPLIVAILMLAVAVVFGPSSYADSSVTNFRMSDQPGGPHVYRFLKGTRFAYAMFDYHDTDNTPIGITVWDSLGQIVFHHVKSYTGSGSETITVQQPEGEPFREDEYLTTLFYEYGPVDSASWVVLGTEPLVPFAYLPIIIRPPLRIIPCVPHCYQR